MKTERIRQQTTITWAASTAPSMMLDNAGLVTRYELDMQITPSATLVAANQPDGLFRPLQKVDIISGGETYITLPSEDGGHGGTMLHALNQLDKLGVGHAGVGITAPQLTYTPIGFVIHMGAYPRRRDGVDNPFDLSAFIPSFKLTDLQMVWTTPGNAVMDDTVTISSGSLVVTANRVIGSEAEILAEMEAQGVTRVLPPGARGMVPSWVGGLQSPTTTYADYGLELNAILEGFLKRVTFLAQDATATRPVRATDELTRLKFSIDGVDLLRVQAQALSGAMPSVEQQGADDAVPFGGAAPNGIFPVDLRPYGRNATELVYGLDFRNKVVGTVKWGQTIGLQASGDDILVLSERYKPYVGALA